MKNVFINNRASANRIRLLAEWLSTQASPDRNKNFDVIRFVEIDLPKIVPNIYIHIEADNIMGSRRAFISNDPLGIVVSESIYEGASRGCLFSSEVVMHEVGHLLIHHKHAAVGLNSAADRYETQVMNMRIVEGAEWQATTFAMSFIYPLYKLKNVKSTKEIALLYNATINQSSRILRHVDRLRSGDKQSDAQADRRWLKAIVKNFPQTKEMERSPYTKQLDLFFGHGKRIATRQAQPMHQL